MPSSTLTETQQQVLTLISAGATIAASAREAGVHRNTIYNWLRSSEFRDALEQARYHHALYWHEHAANLAEAAFNTLADVLETPETPVSLRVRVALAIVNRVSTPPPPPPLVLSPSRSEPTEKAVERQAPEELNFIEQELKKVHNSAQSQPMDSPKPGRNDLCPCGSGVKFKRCCLNKTHTPSMEDPPGAVPLDNFVADDIR